MSTRSTEKYTIVYLRADRLPKETMAVTINVVDEAAALLAFINMRGMENMFVTCVVRGGAELVKFTK